MRRFLDLRPAQSSCAPPARPLASRFLFSVFLVISLAWPTGLAGQNIRDLGRGDRVRLTPSNGPSMEGSFLELGPRGLSILDSSSGEYTIPIASLRALEMSSGHRRGRGALIGGGIGFVAGLFLGAATSGDCTGDCDDFDGGMGAFQGGAILGGVGAVAGAIFLASERWVTINLGSAGRIAPMVRLRLGVF